MSLKVLVATVIHLRSGGEKKVCMCDTL